MKVLSTLILATAINAIGIGSASAAVVFSDNFDAYNYAINATTVDFSSNWLINSGSVDIIGDSTPFDFLPGNGKYVDLDGSTNAGGELSTNSFSLGAGSYLIQFSLAGSQNGDSNDVTVSFGSYSETFTLASSDPFQTYTKTVVFGSAVSTALSFKNSGGDNTGALLDNVSITAVPEPGSSAMVFAGLMMIAGLVVRKSKTSN